MHRSNEEPIKLLAHSADAKRRIPAQEYAVHVDGVVLRAVRAAVEAAKYSATDGELLHSVGKLASEYHDLGKLDPLNQGVLNGRRKAESLPVQHTEAGTAYLLNKLKAMLGAVMVRSHHIGLPDFIKEQNRKDDEVLRDEHAETRIHVDKTLDELVKQHSETRGEEIALSTMGNIQGNPALFQRIALSCLADGDHTDTACYYGEYAENNDAVVHLRPNERLARLDSYVAALSETDERSRLRTEVYAACRNANLSDLKHIFSCDSPVGTGKTTAVMACLLALAKRRGLRRIFVVLPYTNIIQQSVNVYRKALVLDDESPEQVVAELHHRADYQDIYSRQFTALWKAPIIVTTAVAFFETLASNSPATLRRLHNLPGSAVFLDEAHAALPAKYLPLAWQWIGDYAKEWSCCWVLASGSLNRFWEIDEFDSTKPAVPELLPHDLRNALAQYEGCRVSYKFRDEAMTATELVNWVVSLPGPRLVIVNTVQSAAAIADEYAKMQGREKVEHLSTALTPNDRDATLKNVKKRLQNTGDTDWALIATSCVEAGVDLSFKSGIREIASLVSLLQTAGRVNRHGTETDTTIWTIELQEGGLLKKHPMMTEAAQVLREIFNASRTISPELCTEALQREVRLSGSFVKELVAQETQLRFPMVEEKFHVIASDTRTVVVNREIIARLESYQPVTWQEIQKSSVQIWGYRLNDLKAQEIHGRPGMYKWDLAYDDFLGYMRGILAVEFFKKGINGAYVV
ncbi:MAG: DEAD/DEAH box helicase [Lentisphaerae bacterium]|nr:DEAD/DEAH box helicase [Lentisphaerota bacterium]